MNLYIVNVIFSSIDSTQISSNFDRSKRRKYRFLPNGKKENVHKNKFYRNGKVFYLSISKQVIYYNPLSTYIFLRKTTNFIFISIVSRGKQELETSCSETEYGNVFEKYKKKGSNLTQRFILYLL
jgi:hypothetical protein